jgi:hypothetical protein
MKDFLLPGVITNLPETDRAVIGILPEDICLKVQRS